MIPTTYILGDPHFSANRPWRLEIGNVFLDWLESWQVPPDSYLIVLGDMSDSAMNPGKVVKQLERFAQITSKKFLKVFLLKGNHDEKIYQDEPHLSFDFLRLNPKIEILEEPAQQLDIGGLSILSLPFYKYRNDIPSIYDYYAKLPKDISEKQYDLIIGHFADTSAFVFESQIDIGYLKTQITALGHVHTRNSPNYVGSVYPCKISEQLTNLPARAVWCIKKENGSIVKTEIKLPEFCKYSYIDYPNPLPKKDEKIIHIWTVRNCPNEGIAKSFYKGEHIRGIDTATSQKVSIGSGDDESFIFEKPLTLFNEWLHESKTLLSRTSVKICRDLLAEKSS